jgi:hypothetical protein
MEPFDADGRSVDAPYGIDGEFVYVSPGSLHETTLNLVCGPLEEWPMRLGEPVTESLVSFSNWMFEVDETPVTNPPP